MYTYDRLFNAYNHTVAQILLTGVDVEHTDRRVNFQTTLNRLLELGALPKMCIRDRCRISRMLLSWMLALE